MPAWIDGLPCFRVVRRSRLQHLVHPAVGTVRANTPTRRKSPQNFDEACAMYTLRPPAIGRPLRSQAVVASNPASRVRHRLHRGAAPDPDELSHYAIFSTTPCRECVSQPTPTRITSLQDDDGDEQARIATLVSRRARSATTVMNGSVPPFTAAFQPACHQHRPEDGQKKDVKLHRILNTERPAVTSRGTTASPKLRETEIKTGSVPIQRGLDWQDRGPRGLTHALSAARASARAVRRILRCGRRIRAAQSDARPSTSQPPVGRAKDLMPRISVGRKDGTGGLVRPQAVTGFYFPNYVPVEASEVPLHEFAIQMDRLVQLLCNYGCCRERSDQRA